MEAQRAEAMLQTQKRRVAQKIFTQLTQSLGVLTKGQTLGLAVSGGLDSRALLEAVARWPLRHEFDFFVVSVNHGVRTESFAECEAVAARAKVLGFDSEVVSIFPGTKKDEASLRVARYNAIWRSLSGRGIRLCCVAHQKDDNAEGVVMDLFGLGGGVSGAGMAAVRADAENTLVRPFLELERSLLHLFLSSLSITDYFVDPSNKNGSNQRQKARDFLTKTASQLHPRPIERLAKVAQYRLEEQELVAHFGLERTAFGQTDNSIIKIPISPKTPPSLLRGALKRGYKAICEEHDPRNAAPGIDAIVKKAKSLALIQSLGVDPSGNSITLEAPIRLYFDLPGAKALMTPVMVSLYRNQNDLLVQ